MGSYYDAAHLCVASYSGITSRLALMRHKPDFITELQNLAEMICTLPRQAV